MNKVKGLVVVGALILTVISGYFVLGTYAKYTSSISGTGSATVAKWSFDTDNNIGTINLNITPTADASTLVAGKIAPGTSGSFDVALVNTNTEVGVNASVSMSATGVPTNLKFYSDDDYQTEITVENPLTGTLAAGDSTGITKTIYWRWAYETGNAPYDDADETDTTEGSAASSLTVTVNVTGTQVQPSVSAITSNWN